MKVHRTVEQRIGRAQGVHALRLVAGFAVVVSMMSPAANAAGSERSGSEVVTTVCAACHATGENGAPRIGDEKAWAARASLGLTALSGHALQGIRNMPAHGGNAGLSDSEIKRAIVHMVNASGGHWVEPIGGAATLAVPRGGEQIVARHCSQCHKDALGGAPRIGDRAAWTPRMSTGLAALVKSAVHGHGGMPPRGGVADLSDSEIRDAVVYMFNYGVKVVPSEHPKAAVVADPYHKLVGGAHVYLGIQRAEFMNKEQAAGAVPKGKGYYHLNVSLFDAKTRSAITDAKVELRVADPIWTETKELKAISANKMTSYGGFFRMSGQNPYTITAQISRPGVAGAAETKFEFRPR